MIVQEKKERTAIYGVFSCYPYISSRACRPFILQHTFQCKRATLRGVLDVQGGWAKKWPNLFLSERRQICTKFDNFWHTDSQDDRIMSGTLTFHLT